MKSTELKEYIWEAKSVKPFYWRLLNDFLSSSIWFIGLIVFFWLKNGFDLFIIIVFLPVFVLIFIKHYRSNFTFVKKAKIKGDFLSMDILKLNQPESLGVDIKKIDVKYYRSVRSYPLQAHLKYSKNKEKVFRHFQTRGWKKDDLFSIKEKIEEIKKSV